MTIRSLLTYMGAWVLHALLRQHVWMQTILWLFFWNYQWLDVFKINNADVIHVKWLEVCSVCVCMSVRVNVLAGLRRGRGRAAAAWAAGVARASGQRAARRPRRAMPPRALHRTALHRPHSHWPSLAVTGRHWSPLAATDRHWPPREFCSRLICPRLGSQVVRQERRVSRGACRLWVSGVRSPRGSTGYCARAPLGLRLRPPLPSAAVASDGRTLMADYISRFSTECHFEITILGLLCTTNLDPS